MTVYYWLIYCENPSKHKYYPANGPVAMMPRDPVELRDDGVLVVVGVALVQHVQLQCVPAAVDGVLARRVPVHLPEPVRHAVDHHAARVRVEPHLKNTYVRTCMQIIISYNPSRSSSSTTRYILGYWYVP